MRSEIFYTDRYLRLQETIKQFLNSQEDFLSPRTLGSPRAVGDAIQDILSESFQKLLGDACAECSTDFARRAMAACLKAACAKGFGPPVRCFSP